ncbi:MAG: hydroxyacid dehydrogenase [Bacteroidetes bacterium]|nr:MAG: hydroxyacid dehydrogenase [Bacteroidota bacterium]
MKVAVYSTHLFEKDFLVNENKNRHILRLLELPLNGETAYLANGNDAACIFVNDDASGPTLKLLYHVGIRYLVLRSAGYNHVDLKKAKELDIRVARVPAYSPHAVAEHTVALMLALNRKLIRSNSRVHDLNFSLNGLIGFDMNGKIAGVIGTGQIGEVLIKILHGFGCQIYAFDVIEKPDLKNNYGVQYVSLEEIYAKADIISLHVPLTDKTHYMVNQNTIDQMKPGVMLINTSRGALINTKDVIDGLKAGRIGYLGLDVYEEEDKLFFKDRSEDILQDDIISRLLTFKNVMITSHQAFLTDTALRNIAGTTFYNLDCWEKGVATPNELD